MAKKAVKKQPSVMEQIAAAAPPWYDEPEGDDKTKGADEQVKSLTAQLAAMQAKMEGMERQNAYSSFQSAPGVAQAQQKAVDPAKTVLDLKGLPDPVTKTEEYNAALMERMNQVLDARDQVRAAEVAVREEQVALQQNLWNGFKSAHPEWAEQEMLVGAAAGRVSQELLGRGVNVVQLMKQQPDLFYKEVAGVLDKQFPTLKKGAAEEEGEDEDGPAEVFGGQAGGRGGSLTGAGQALEDENKAWMKELGDWKVKAGLR